MLSKVAAAWCRLWNLTPDNLSAISKETRRHKPSLREFLEPVVAEMDPEDGIEEQYKVGSSFGHLRRASVQ